MISLSAKIHKTHILQNGIADPTADWAVILNISVNNIEKESPHNAFQLNNFFSFLQCNLILLSSHLFLLPPGFVGSELAFGIKCLGLGLSVRKGVSLACV